MGLLNDLIKRLNRAFNKDPKLAVAITISPSQYPAFYSIRDGVFTLAVNGMPTYVKGLDGLTVYDLVGAINIFFSGHIGATASVASPSFAALLAIGLFETSQDLSDDGNIYFPTSCLYSELQTYSITLKEQADRKESAERELYANSADGVWLDFWLGYFGIFRLNAEGDLAFFTRALAEVLSPKVNNEAMAIILERSLGFVVDVKDLATETIELFMTNIPLSVTNGNAFPDVLYNNMAARSKSGCFGVYLYSGSINNLDPRQKAAVLSLVNRCKASGKVAEYYAPTGQIITNTPGSILNSQDFATGPVPGGWAKVTI